MGLDTIIMTIANARPGPLWLHRSMCGLMLLCAAQAASAQAEISYGGVLDLSYGRFEPAGLVRENRFNSNSMTASFVSVTARYGLDRGWTPGVTLESFVRLHDFQAGRRDGDPPFSRNAFVSLNSRHGLFRMGRLQTPMFETGSRFNAFGNSTVFSPPLRHVFQSGNMDGVQGDFYWNRSLGYTSPTWEGVAFNAIHGKGATALDGDYTGASIVLSRGLFAVSLSGQHVRVDDGIDTPIHETAWQLAASHDFGVARAFGLHAQTDDRELQIHSKTGSAGVSIPLGPGRLLLQAASTSGKGPAVDRRHSSVSAGYVYEHDSVTEAYLMGMDDQVRGQTRGVSVAAGVRWRF